MLNNQREIDEKLRQVISKLCRPHARSFPKCMPDEDAFDDGNISMQSIQDTHSWKPSMPSRVGIYHAFARNSQTLNREHKLFIVIHGSSKAACEEIYNLWHDCKSKITCKQLIDCEEFHWTKSATVRSHNRIAAMVSQKLGLDLKIQKDYDCPTNETYMTIPTIVTFVNDIQHSPQRNVVEYVSGACFTDKAKNGIVLDTNGIDGYWIFCGPHSNTSDSNYGTELRSCTPFVYPSICASYPTHINTLDHVAVENLQQQKVLMPNEAMMQKLEKMGFDRNDDVIYLMGIVSLHTTGDS